MIISESLELKKGGKMQMYGRRKTDKALLFMAVWAVLLGLTSIAMNCGVLVPITHVSVAEKIAVTFALPTLATIVVFSISYFLKSRGG